MSIGNDTKDKGHSIEFLMSRFAVRRSTWLAKAIVHHLEAIARTPDHQQHQRLSFSLIL